MPTVGQAMSRVDGPLKVTGGATYAYEHWELGQPLYGFIVGATIGRGRITRMDTTAAEASPGVRLVMTHSNAPEQGTPDLSVFLPFERALPLLTSAEIRRFGEPVALVVAETFEQARCAAGRVLVEYAAETGSFDFAAAQQDLYAPEMLKLWPTDTASGDFDSGFAAAAVKVDEEYTTPYQAAQPMEPHACLANWDGDRLTVYAGTQTVANIRARVAATLRMDPKHVDVRSEFVGGAFGSKVSAHAEIILAAVATRQLQRPVKVAMTRQQVFQLVGNRAATRQRLRLGASRDGVLVAIAHEANVAGSPLLDYPEHVAIVSRTMYAAANRVTRHRVTQLDIEPPDDMRAPGESPGLLALESAMDELAYALGMDPVELRIRNEPTLDPERGVPFSQRRLVECMKEGARRFGWERRVSTPGTVRDGRWLVGQGMAAGVRMHLQGAVQAAVRLAPDGTATVRTDMTDIGTGTYTILTQVAADALDVPLEQVYVELGSSDLPPGAGSNASWGAASSSNAVHHACQTLREKLRSNGGRIPEEGLEASGSIGGLFDDPNHQAYSIHSWAAQFAEVGVDMDTGEIRLRRMLGVFSVGRILNPTTARSQLIGGMIWGASAALHEEAIIDRRTGAYVNRDLAGYLVPVHADIPEIDAVMLDGFDDKANPYGVKGVGEIGLCGSSAAVANAVFNATGVRVRKFPITLEKVFMGQRLSTNDL